MLSALIVNQVEQRSGALLTLSFALGSRDGGTPLMSRVRALLRFIFPHIKCIPSYLFHPKVAQLVKRKDFLDSSVMAHYDILFIDSRYFILTAIHNVNANSDTGRCVVMLGDVKI